MANKIITLQKARLERLNQTENLVKEFKGPQVSINECLLIASKEDKKLKNKIEIMTFEEFRQLIRKRLMKIALEIKEFSTEIYNTILYISNLIYESLTETFHTMFAVDYLKKAENSNNPFYLQSGGNLCFMINTIFEKRGNFRMMKPEDYANFGKAFYSKFYNETRNEIGYQMSNNYDLLKNMTNQTLADIKEDSITSFKKEKTHSAQIIPLF